MKAIVTTVNSIKFGKEPFVTTIIDDANRKELDGDFLIIYKRSLGLFNSTLIEERAVFRAADIVKVIFEEGE